MSAWQAYMTIEDYYYSVCANVSSILLKGLLSRVSSKQDSLHFSVVIKHVVYSLYFFFNLQEMAMYFYCCTVSQMMKNIFTELYNLQDSLQQKSLYTEQEHQILLTVYTKV